MSTQSLQDEYYVYLTNLKRLQLMTNYKNKKLSYEGRNILERYLISAENSKSPEELSSCKQKMISEIEDKKLGLGNPHALAGRVFAVNIARAETPELLVLKSESITTLNYGKFSREISNDRMELLLKFADVAAVAKCAIRYGSILGGSQQWNIPASVYKVLHFEYGATLEAFASPFNSQLLPYYGMDSSDEVQFCSLYGDTDEIFGSVGNFFDYDIDLGIHNVLVVNPPYILDLLTRAAAKCIDICARAQDLCKPVKIFLIVPNWIDANYFTTLESSEYLEHAIKLTAGTYYYEDTTQNKKIVARFNSTMFVLGVGTTRQSYDNISAAFSVSGIVI